MKVHEPNVNAKYPEDYNKVILESIMQIEYMNYTNYLFIEKEMKDLVANMPIMIN